MSFTSAPCSPEDERVKKFTTAMDAALSSFDSINEWADFIAFLNKLSKVLSQFASQQFLCRKVAVSKRLSQCLNPALPAGVHSKALEVYDQIYCLVSREFLEQNIGLLTCGLFSFFKFCSISVKPMLLDIYESKFILCDSALRLEVMPNVMASLFAGLEEPNEFFDRITELLWRLQEGNRLEFFHHFWCILNDFEHLRLGCGNFVLKNCKKFASKMKIVAEELDFDIVCLATAKAIVDRDSLVVRQTLDVVCALFCLQEASGDNWILSRRQKLILLQAVLTCLLKKNFSLTRRVYNWIEGGNSEAEDPSHAHSPHALQKETQELLCDCFEQMLANSIQNCNTSALLPFKIMCHFLDKGDIANAVLEQVFIRFLLAAFQRFQREECLEKKLEFLAGVNRLFEMVDLNVSWSQILKHLQHTSIDANEDLLAFTLLQTKLVEQEAKNLMLPNLFLFLVQNQCTETKLLNLIAERVEFTKDYNHSLVQTAPKLEEPFCIQTNVSFVYSNCVFWMCKLLIGRELSEQTKKEMLNLLSQILTGITHSIIINLLKDLNLVLADPQQENANSLHSKVCTLLLVKHKLVEIEHAQEFTSYILSNGGFLEREEILKEIQQMFPKETELFFLSTYSHRHTQFQDENAIDPEKLIAYWNAFPNVPMLVTTCLLIDSVDLDNDLNADCEPFNAWILSQECNFEKVLLSLLLFFSSSHSTLAQVLRINGKQLEYFFDKLLFLLRLRREDFLFFLSSTPTSRIYSELSPLLKEILGSEGKVLGGICLLIGKFVELFPLSDESLAGIHHQIVQLTVLLWESGPTLSGPEQEVLLPVIERIYCNLSLFDGVNSVNLLIGLISSLSSCSLTFSTCQDRIAKILAKSEKIYSNSTLTTRIIHLALELYAKGSCDLGLSLLDSVMRSLIETKQCEKYLALPLLFLFNGGSLRGIEEVIKEVACFSQIQSAKGMSEFLTAMISSVSIPLASNSSKQLSQLQQAQSPPQLKRSILTQDFLLLFLSKAFNCSKESPLNFIFIVAFLLDPDAFVEGILRYWSQSVYEQSSEIADLIFCKINFFCSIGILSYSKFISLSLNACLFSKKSNSTSVLINEAIGLDMLLGLISHGTWKPSEQEWSTLASCLKDFFEGNRGRFTFMGCKIFHFLLSYPQGTAAQWTDKKTLRDIQDAYIRLLLASATKISKLITLTKKSAGATGDENGMNATSAEISTFLTFCSYNIFIASQEANVSHSASPLKEMEKGPEQVIAKFISDVAIPLIMLKSHFNTLGWCTLAAIARAGGTWVKIVRDFSIEPLLFSAKEISSTAQTAKLKNELLAACWTSQGTGESDRLLDWIGNKLIIPLPSNVNMLFMNKEVEYASKSETIRQITAIIFCAPRAHFSSALHAILEKIVEAFRVLERCSVHMEIFLLIKVLLARFPLSSLAHFFPIVAFEIYSLLGMVALPLANLTNEFGSGEYLGFVYVACQVLDLMWLLKDHEYQGYLNLFYGNDGKSGLFDKWRASLDQCEDYLHEEPQQVSKKRPVLVQPLSQIKSIGQFFGRLERHAPAQARINAFYGEVDWEYLDERLREEIYCTSLGPAAEDGVEVK